MPKMFLKVYNVMLMKRKGGTQLQGQCSIGQSTGSTHYSYLVIYLTIMFLI